MTLKICVLSCCFFIETFPLNVKDYKGKKVIPIFFAIIKYFDK